MKTITPTLLALLAAAASSTALAQGTPFDSGSNGSMGALVVTADTTLNVPPDGVFHYTTISITGGVTVTLQFNRNALNTPVYLLAQGDVTIGAFIGVSGLTPAQSAQFYGVGGPGGYDGGMAGTGGDTPTPGGDGKGPGGGKHGVIGGAASDYTNGGGGYSSRYTNVSYPNIRSGAIYGSPLLIPLVGGSGGGGVDGLSTGGGGGGAGAILIASNTKIKFLNTAGRIYAVGGSGTQFFSGGSGGAIRLVAPLVVGNGLLYVDGGQNGGAGRIRIDSIFRVNPNDATERLALTYNPGPDVATIGSNMVVFPTNLPRLDITQAAGQDIAVGATSSVLVTLPIGSNPAQTVTVRAQDFGRVVPIRVVLTPDSGDAIVYDTTIDNATTNPATTTVNVTFPTNVRVEVNAWTR